MGWCMLMLMMMDDEERWRWRWCQDAISMCEDICWKDGCRRKIKNKTGKAKQQNNREVGAPTHTFSLQIYCLSKTIYLLISLLFAAFKGYVFRAASIYTSIYHFIIVMIISCDVCMYVWWKGNQKEVISCTVYRGKTCTGINIHTYIYPSYNTHITYIHLLTRYLVLVPSSHSWSRTL